VNPREIRFNVEAFCEARRRPSGLDATPSEAKPAFIFRTIAGG
jgi:hypothetical protein